MNGWRDWLEKLWAEPWMAHSDHAAEVLRLLDDLEQIADTYEQLFGALENAGHADTNDDGFDMVARVRQIAQRDEAMHVLAEQAGLIDEGDTMTDLVPLLRMFLPV